MDTANNSNSGSFASMDEISARVQAYLDTVFDKRNGFLWHIDPWTRGRISRDNLGKVALVLADAEPEEACYRDLIREIDTEARTGIYLAGESARAHHLQQVVKEPGVSGLLDREMNRIAPICFADELARSRDGHDLVSVAIQAGHDHAYLDASVSEIIMSFLIRDTQRVLEVVEFMRATQYTYHEHVVRNRVNLPLLLHKSARQDLRVTVGEMAIRSGSYDERVAEIGRRAEAISRFPRVLGDCQLAGGSSDPPALLSD